MSRSNGQWPVVFVIHCYSIVPVWTAKEIYAFIWKKGVRFICTSMPVASVPIYLWKTAVSLLCCIFYKLELWTSMENLHVNWYILWMLTWISHNFFQHIIYCLNDKMNFAWSLAWISRVNFARISSACYMLVEHLHECHLNCLIHDCC